MRAPYLMRRASGFYFRIRVPADLVGRVGLVEIRRSLGLVGFHEARALASRIGSQTRKVFVMLRRIDDLTENEVANLIRDCFAELRAEADRPFTPRTNDPLLERQIQSELSAEHRQGLEEQLAYRNYGREVSNSVRAFSASKQIDVEGASESRANALNEGVARSLIERDRCFEHRLADSVSPYSPIDPLFAEGPRSLSDCVGLTLNELIEAYMRSHKATWRPKTYQTHGPKLALLAEYVGGDRAAQSIKRQDLIHFPDELLRLRRNHHTQPTLGFHSKQTDNPKAQIKPSTAEGILARTTGLFSWAFRKGYLTSNPAEKLTITKPKIQKGAKGRRSFTKDELEQIFSAPLFTGCRSYHRRHDPGDEIIKDEQFWLPILAYYTGARLGELVQLYLSDCALEEDCPYISINENGSKDPSSADYKHVKSDAGVRLIPLHPDLFDLGFREFWRRQKKMSRNQKRLFFRIKYGADGLPSSPYSKKFGRFLTKIGLDDSRLVFHSFRHTMMDAFRNTGTSKFIVDQIIGHQDRSAAAQYGVGVSNEVAWQAMTELKLPISLTDFLQSTAGEKP